MTQNGHTIPDIQAQMGIDLAGGLSPDFRAVLKKII